MLDLGYVTKGLWSEEDMEGLAQQAMCELYDLTGTQVEECYYYATDGHRLFLFCHVKRGYGSQ